MINSTYLRKKRSVGTTGLPKNHEIIKSSYPCSILNRIIDIGGTTAYENPLTEAQFSAYFLTGDGCVICHVCEDSQNNILGFQAVYINTDLPQGWLDIATFCRQEPKLKGVGTQLFDSTRHYAQQNDVLAINATIRADNSAGLSYYAKMGFVDYHTHRAIPLADGTPIDRISKRFDLS